VSGQLQDPATFTLLFNGQEVVGATELFLTLQNKEESFVSAGHRTPSLQFVALLYTEKISEVL
jgi:hypothetical protein